MLAAQLWPTLCDPVDCSPARLLCGILQAKVLERVAISSPGDLPDPGVELASLTSPALAGGFFTTNATWEAPDHRRPSLKILKSGSQCLLLCCFHL